MKRSDSLIVSLLVFLIGFLMFSDVREYWHKLGLISTLRKSFPLRISLVNVTKSEENGGLFTFTGKILNGKLHFVCIGTASQFLSFYTGETLTLLAQSQTKRKNSLKFLFSHFFVVLKRFYEGLKGLRKTF